MICWPTENGSLGGTGEGQKGKVALVQPGEKDEPGSRGEMFGKRGEMPMIELTGGFLCYVTSIALMILFFGMSVKRTVKTRKIARRLYLFFLFLVWAGTLSIWTGHGWWLDWK